MIGFFDRSSVRTFAGRLMAATAFTAVSLAPFQAAAQAQNDQSSEETASRSNRAEGAGNDVIIVSASRTAQDGLQAPTPTQVVSAAAIDREAATTVMEVLNENPAFKATRSPGANATNTASPAQATADLRALGGQRTLVLVNQSRVVPFAPASNLGVPTTTDLNLFPTLMIERVDVVTGGASALYGSDAVSGVVNIIMKKKYDGINAVVQSGISEEGDYRTLRAGFIAGTSFADDRADVVVSVDYSDNTGAPDIYTRDWGRQEYMIVSNGQRDTNGLEAYILAQNVHNSLGQAGVITSDIPGLYDMTFNSDGTLRPFDRGTIWGGSTMIGGEGASTIKRTDLVPAVERLTAYGSLYYDLTDSVTAYIEGGWSRSIGVLDGVPMRLSTITFQRDNAFVPQGVLDLLPAGTDSFKMSRIAYDIPNNIYRIVNETPHAVAGFDADLGNTWKLDGHVSYGINYYTSETYKNPIRANLNFALDAVDEGAYLTGTPNGNIVCRGVADGNPAAAGCLPMNLFGENNADPAAVDYVWGEGQAKVKYDQLAVGANLVGEPFSTWAGPVVVAIGGEYRKETQKLTADAVASNNGFLTAGNAVPYSGKFNVKEGYIEATVPLADDLAFARTLNLNGAVRYADYSSVGGQTAWKLGGVWEPFDGFNIRVARSRDIRAPAINELTSPGSNVTNNVTLVIDGVSKNAVIPQNTSAGNPNAEAETADTWTAGFAYRGSGSLSGLGVSVDYYNIKISNAITNLSTVTIANLCSRGDDYFCSLFTYGPDARTDAPNDLIHTGLVAGSLNVGAFQQEGLDVTLNYGTDVGFLGDGGRYQINASGTYVFHAYVDSGTGDAPIDRAGENGWANLGAIPRFRGNLSQTLGNDAMELTLQTVFISKGKQDVVYNTRPTNTINDNTVPAVTYFNLYGKFFVGHDRDTEFFWAINNLFDKDPPPTPYIILNGPVNGQYYDKIGRNFMIGFRKKF